MIFVRKMPEFYIIIARKIFFPNFRGARAPLALPHLLRLWKLRLLVSVKTIIVYDIS